MKTLSIVIVNWNTKDFLRDALSSIYEEIGDIDAEIFVVDNASSDGSAEMVKREFPDVNLIKNDANLGFARANNQAIREGKGEYFFLINPDTLVLPGSIHKMLSFMEANPTAGAAGCIHLDGSGNKRYLLGGRAPNLVISSIGLFYEALIERLLDASSKSSTVKIRSIRDRLGSIICARPTERQREFTEVDLIDGCGFMVRREVIEKVGLLNEEYFHGNEDAEWCERIIREGSKLYIVNDAEIIHYGKQSYKQSEYAALHTYNCDVIYFRNKYGKYLTSFYKASAVLSALSGIILSVPVYIASSAARRKNILSNIKTNARLLGHAWKC